MCVFQYDKKFLPECLVWFSKTSLKTLLHNFFESVILGGWLLFKEKFDVGGHRKNWVFL